MLSPVFFSLSNCLTKGMSETNQNNEIYCIEKKISNHLFNIMLCNFNYLLQ